ncbi:uncharacterized protein LOC125659938 [Ostrea edulis]|uniref:uncharacterized protein LOC125659938 n=1 Tax=Ostrea edulis TaxID=37623 RepID=UPI0024AF3700|nr:uncharacterized protein LOC125659938 [Ostrea edulis]
MEEKSLLVGCLLLVVTIINAQPPVQTYDSEIPLIATLGVAGISASVTTVLLSAGIGNLRSELDTCEQTEENLTSTFGDLSKCITNLNEKLDEWKDCQNDLKECEEALAQRQTDLKKTEADLTTCNKDYDDIEDFLKRFTEVYPDEIYCASALSENECNAITGCTWKDSKEFCEKTGTVIITK